MPKASLAAGTTSNSALTKRRWTTNDIPSLRGRFALVTGANSGIGLQTAQMLAKAGAHVVLACRNMQKAEAAAAQIRLNLNAPNSGSVSVESVDVSSLDSVAEFAARIRSKHSRIDILINNAGVMMPPYTRTVDGFEMQFGTNHLGHFALNAHLIDLIAHTPGARIVTIASVSHLLGKIRFDDIHWEKRYSAFPAYAMSKLANLIYARELGRRLKAAGASALSLAAHPGWTASDIGGHRAWMNLPTKILAQSTARGALPTVRAAVDTTLQASGLYVGPSAFHQLSGDPVLAPSTAQSRNEQLASRLWDLSESLVDQKLAVPALPNPKTPDAYATSQATN